MKPDIKRKFEVARRELSLYRDVAASTINTCVHEPVPRSPLYIARSSLTLYEAYASAVQRLASGLNHLAAILILWSNESISHFACHTVTRGLLEVSARTVWLLARSISEDQRAARGLLERVEGSGIATASSTMTVHKQSSFCDTDSSILRGGRDRGRPFHRIL